MSHAHIVPSETASAVKCDLAGEVLRRFGNLRFGATGLSMLPTVWPGDTLVVERAHPDQVSIGDVVLVGREGRLCAHRVVSRIENSGNPQWITRGDAMPEPDRPVSESELLGRVAYLVRAGRLMAVPSELSVIERLTGTIVGRSVPAARALVFLHRAVVTLEKSGSRKLASEKSAAGKSVLPCQG